MMSYKPKENPKKPRRFSHKNPTFGWSTDGMTTKEICVCPRYLKGDCDLAKICFPLSSSCTTAFQQTLFCCMPFPAQMGSLRAFCLSSNHPPSQRASSSSSPRTPPPLFFKTRELLFQSDWRGSSKTRPPSLRTRSKHVVWFCGFS